MSHLRQQYILYLICANLKTVLSKIVLKTGILAISSVEGELLGALPPPQKKVFFGNLSQIWVGGWVHRFGKVFQTKGFFCGGASLIMCDRRDIDTIRHIGRAVRFV